MLEVAKEYSLKFTYTSKSVSTLRGMFRTFSTNPKTGQKTTILSTNFMPQYASSVFPCYDDPEFKATFTLSIQHPAEYEAISNMEVVSLVPHDVSVTTTFQKTPLLAAHSIAFSVLNYQSECDSSSSLNICVYYDDQHTADDVRLVLQTAKEVLIELETYLGIGLELTKLDIIPVDSSAPTIGNYGLLINRLSDYYYNPETSNVAHKDRVIRQTIRHILNLYFVNIVTPEWWDDIWIINGISLILEHTIANKLYPETDATNEFINSLYEYATKRIIYLGPGLLNLEGIESLLDNSNQNRAAAIMYMFQNIVGADIYKAGLKKLLSGNSRSFNSETFFNTFESLGITDDLNTIMNTWTKQDSYPVLNAVRNYDANNVILSQDNVLNVYDNYVVRTNLFWLPVSSIKQQDDVSEWLDTGIIDWLENTRSREISFTTETLDNSDWIIYNKELSGFYHTNYDSDNWNLLAQQLDRDFTVIPWITRTQLLHDSILFALNDQLTLDVMFKIANYVNKEDEFAPLTRFIAGFKKLDAIIFGTNVYSNFTKFTVHKIKHLYERVRIIDLNENFYASITDLKLRKPVIDIACHLGHEQCVNDTNSLLKDLIDQAGGIELLLEHECGETILYNGMALADSDLFWKIFALRDTLEFNNFAEALGQIQNHGVIDELLTVLITKNGDKVSGVEINLTANERREIFEKLINYNLAALDKSLTFAIDNSGLIKELWFNTNKYSIPNSFLNMIKTDERLQMFLVIDAIYLGGKATNADENVKLASEQISEFEATLTELVESIKDEEITNNDDTGAAVTKTMSILLLVVLAITVHIY